VRIGIDARMYGPMVGGGGLGRYVEQFVYGLQKHNQKHRFVLFLKKENFDHCKITNPLFEKRLAPIHWYGIQEQKIMPKLLKKEHLDLVHFPHWNVPFFCPIPFFVTIHDLILIEHPYSSKVTTRHPIYFAFKYLGYRLILKNALQKSQQIITVTDYVKKSIEKHFPRVSAKKIHRIYEGITYFNKTTSIKMLPHSIQTPYLLYIGNAYPHKNLKGLLNAYAIFSKKYPDIALVLSGPNDLFYARIQEEQKKMGLTSKQVIFIPSPDDQLVASLFTHALMYIQPSFAEGFGLPPLEAMSYGIPVAASNKTSLPEVLADAALYFDPDDPRAIADVLSSLITNTSLRDKLKEKGYNQIKKYSWDTMTKNILDLYETGGVK